MAIVVTPIVVLPSTPYDWKALCIPDNFLHKPHIVHANWYCVVMTLCYRPILRLEASCTLRLILPDDSCWYIRSRLFLFFIFYCIWLYYCLIVNWYDHCITLYNVGLVSFFFLVFLSYDNITNIVCMNIVALWHCTQNIEQSWQWSHSFIFFLTALQTLKCINYYRPMLCCGARQ